MATKVHNFNQSKNTGDAGEMRVFNSLESVYKGVLPVANDRNFFDVDIDFVCIDEDMDTTFVEVKTDTYTAKNGNIFLETWSNYENEKRGWPWITKADYVWYYAAGSDMVYIFRGELLGELCTLFLAEGEEKYVQNAGYSSRGNVLPLEDIPSRYYIPVNLVHSNTDENDE